jgi:hypothetical protein
MQKTTNQDSDLKEVLKKLTSLSISEESNDGWVLGSKAGDYLVKVSSSFSPKAFGFSKLSDLIESHADLFESKYEKQESAPNSLFYYRKK